MACSPKTSWLTSECVSLPCFFRVGSAFGVRLRLRTSGLSLSPKHHCIRTSSCRSISRNRELTGRIRTSVRRTMSPSLLRSRAADDNSTSGYVSVPSGSPSALHALHGLPLWRQTRFHVVVFVAIALLLCNADRVIMSVAIVPLSAANGWSESIGGVVQSSFLWGYLLTPILGGALADRHEGKTVLAVGITVWSLATLLTPWAANHSLGALLAVRAVMGVGEGVALPSMNNMMSSWFPRSELARAVGACFAGFHLGSMGGLLLAPPLLTRWGITGPFLAFGCAGLLWALLWTVMVSTTPAECRGIDGAELRFILEGQPRAAVEGGGGAEEGGKGGWRAKVKVPPFGLLFSKMATWSLVVASMVNNWGYFVLLSWMPIYFNKMFSVNLRRAASFSAGPWAVMAVVGLGAGSIADGLGAKGMSTTAVRKIMQSVAFLGSGLALLGLASAQEPITAAAFLTLALGCSAFSQAGFLVNFQDIGPQYAGVLLGAANTFGTIAGITSTVATGVLVDRFGSFQAVITITAGVYFFGAAFWNLFSTGERVFH